MNKGKKSKIRVQWALLSLCCLLTLFFPKIFGARRYYLASFLFAGFTVLTLFVSFENSARGTLRMAITAVMSAMAIAGRVVFAGFPGIKPVAALIIISGAGLGRLPGFCTGALTMLISNFFFSQGPWTVWQMFSFGLMGFVSGLIFYPKPKLQKPWIMAVFSFVYYLFVAGPILDLSGIFTWIGGSSPALRATLIAGLPVNFTAGIATAVFILALSGPILRKIDRLKVKYGL